AQENPMDKLTTLLSFLAALSIATERITEIIKGLPILSAWLAVERKPGLQEEFRKASVQGLALLAGTLVAYLVRDPLGKQFGVTDLSPYTYWDKSVTPNCLPRGSRTR